MSADPEPILDYPRAITDSMAEGVYAVDREGRLTYMNPAAERRLGWREEELQGLRVHDRIHACERDSAAGSAAGCPILHGAWKGRRVCVDRTVFIRRDGSELAVALTASPLLTESGISGTTVVFAEPSTDTQEDQQPGEQIGSELRDQLCAALQSGRLRLYAQPIVDLRGGETVSNELLLRIMEPDGSVVAPGPFLRAAEHDGLITEIDNWVIDEAAAVAAAGVHVHVNVSARTVGQMAFVERLRDAIERHKLDPALIVLELTETAVLEPSQQTREFLSTVRDIGCGLALDDFGTGYAGLARLKRLPVDQLKIDREFVGDLLTSDCSRYVVQAVVSLARSFGCRTIAEGVEDPATLDLLRELGVDMAQGYLFARPFSVTELAASPTGSRCGACRDPST